ncbi:unnamed protein product [Closterium sp. Naga37s-1]|nr:unnamed protein product [Closterium sp. Naga37s-1]
MIPAKRVEDAMARSLAEEFAAAQQRASASLLPPHSPLFRSQAQRVDVGVARSLAESIEAEASRPARGTPLQRVDDGVARGLAESIEAEAFAATQARAQEGGAAVKGSALVMMYARHASELMVDAFKKERSKGGAAEEGVEEFDISGGKREALSKEAAEKLLAPLLKPNNGCKKVKLSSKAFTLEAADVAHQALTNARDTLTHADLSDIIASLPEEEALQVITRVTSALEGCKLKSLNLSDNAFGEKGVRAAAVALTSQPSLRHLYFCNNGISREAAAAIKELLPDEAVASLETLHFFNNMSGDPGAAILAEVVREARGLKDFRFASTRVGTDGARALADAIAANSTLERLDLRDNMFGPEGGAALASALHHHPNLKQLMLGDTALGDDGVAELLDSLAQSTPQLEVLELGGNELSEEGAGRVAESLKPFSALRKLVLCDNEMGDAGVETLVAIIPDHLRSLEELDLSTNDFGRKGAEAAARAVKDLESFKLLTINGNHIPVDGIRAVKEILGVPIEDGEETDGGKGVLGPLDENDEEGEEDED